MINVCHVGRWVTVTLNSGKEIAGQVASVTYPDDVVTIAAAGNAQRTTVRKAAIVAVAWR